MATRVLVWLGSATLIAGMWAAMLAGAPGAYAETGSSDGAGATSSESTKPAEKQAESPKVDAGQSDTKAADAKPAKSGSTDDVDKRGQDADDPQEQIPADVGKPADDASPPVEKDGTGSAQSPSKHSSPPQKHEVTVEPQKPAAQPVEAAATVSEPPAGTDTVEALKDPTPVVTQPASSTAAEAVALAAPPLEASATPAVARFAAIAAPESATAVATAPAAPSLINVIGTLIFTLYNLATRLFEGPPVLPPGSTVTVRTSTLHIDYGPGYDLPANWYFPADEKPTGLIYFQHGFLASAPFYSYTAATLAEQTHSIVVAPSVTSNFFASDGFWLGGAPYQQAVADLFKGDRTALTDSASAAIGHAVTLPQPVVIAGHSAGGGLALGAAGYMVDNGTIGDLAGLVLLDGVAMSNAAATIDKIPDEVPVYQISSPPYAWNEFGTTSNALVKARPGQFNGVELVGGSHIDAMQGGNPFIQFGAYLVAGFSKPQNIEAVKILAVGWINDMFAGKRVSGIYADPGETIDIPTNAGTATAIALPASEGSLSPLDQLLRWLFVTGSQLMFNDLPTTSTAPPTKEVVAA